jgi:hypothetical protein
MSKSIVLLSLLGLSPWAAAVAQYQPAPTRYTIVNEGGGQTQHFYRDGDKVLVDLVMPKSSDQPVAIHMRTIVDAPSKQQQSWSLSDPSIPCNSFGTGDWGDPFDLWRQMALDDSVAPQRTGTTTLNGMAVTTYRKVVAEGVVQLWRENRYGLLVKAVMTPNGRAPVEMFETKQFTVGAPDAAVFAVPSRCTWSRRGRN